MANVLDHFKFSIHAALEGLEQELVQIVQERLVKEGKSFPGGVNLIEGTVKVDLNAVCRSASSCRTVRQVQQTESKEDYQSIEVPWDQESEEER